MDYLKQKQYLIQFRVGHGQKRFNFLDSYGLLVGNVFDIKSSPAIEMYLETLIACAPLFDIHYSDANESELETSIAVAPGFQPLARDTEHVVIDSLVSVAPTFELLIRNVAYVEIDPIVSVAPLFNTEVCKACDTNINQSIVARHDFTAKSSRAINGEASKTLSVQSTNFSASIANAEHIEATQAISASSECEINPADEVAELEFTQGVSLGCIAEAEAYAIETAFAEAEQSIDATSSLEAILKAAQSFEAAKQINVTQSATAYTTKAISTEASQIISCESLCEAILSIFNYTSFESAISAVSECEASLALSQIFMETEENAFSVSNDFEAILVISNSIYTSFEPQINAQYEATAEVNATPLHVGTENSKIACTSKIEAHTSTPTSTGLEENIISSSIAELSLYGQRKLNYFENMTLDSMSSSTLFDLQFGLVE